MKQIRLFKTANGWMTDFVGDSEIQSLFGTTIIPTAFTAQADSQDVIEEISRLNPRYEVVLS